MEEVKEGGGHPEAKKEKVTTGAPLHRIYRRWWMSAAAILLLSAGVYWGLRRTDQAPPEIVNTEQVNPGKNGAILTLADGSQVLLDTVTNANIGLQGGVTAKVVNGTLQYVGIGNAIVYNTMSTPVGRQFQIKLPDGSEVWLNAASSIRFPTAFAGNERKVEITGEVYFEVAENAAAPFRVKVENKADVEVLGTRFNINAYDDEPVISTTLLSGAVRVKNDRAENVILKPGQQARIAGNIQQGAIKVLNDVAMDKVVAWKNGYFDFEGVAFEIAMRQLERWYDIDVEYENNKVPDIEFIGKITRDVSYKGLLTGLQKMGVRYKQEGRKLVILAAYSQ
jgi:ferric-dicitrate binding protein FerR (iron transport regulator)